MQEVYRELTSPGEKTEAVQFLPDGGVLFAVKDEEAKSVEIEFDLYPSGVSERYPLVSDQNRIWSLTLYDIPDGYHLMNWYFDGVERICATAPIINFQNKLRNYVEIRK